MNRPCKYRKIQKALDKLWATNKNHDKLLIQLQMASNAFDKIASRFGMTLADRTRIKVEQTPGQSASTEMAEILGLRSVG